VSEMQNIINDRIKGIKISNEIFEYWRGYLEENHGMSLHLKYMDIPLWDMFIGGWAPHNHFDTLGSRASGGRREVHNFSRVKKIIMLIAKSFLMLLYKPVVSKTKVLFVAFERRQICTFTKAIDVLSKRSVGYKVLTTIFPSHEFPAEFTDRECVAYLENHYSLLSSMGEISEKYNEISKWINSVGKVANLLEPKKSKELSIVLGLIKRDLLYSLIVLKGAHNIIKYCAPETVVSSDNADIRIRAVFLTARKHGIKTKHATYCSVRDDSFEEKYLVADTKLVFNEKQKQKVLQNYGLGEERVRVLGCPRFDELFELREQKNTSDAHKISSRTELTILLGSQPVSTATYGLGLTEMVKRSKLETVFQVLRKSGKNIKVYIKPHPDESEEEINDIVAIANNYSTTTVVLDYVDFKKAISEVDLFITFYSNLALEFMICDIPVCFLLPVQRMPIFDGAVERGIACQALTEGEFQECIENFIFNYNKDLGHVDEFLKTEFFKIDGTVSEDLVELIT
jgi:CDP-glycerol:poly(glycerophosphate) glycerophosphotransferase